MDVRGRSLGRLHTAAGAGLSQVGFGAWEMSGAPWGSLPSEEAAIDTITRTLREFTNWVDTAEAYGHGLSERLVGAALKKVTRDEVFVISKVAPQPFGSGFSKAQVRSACERTLQRLETSYLDLYLLHDPDESPDAVPVLDSWEAMAELADRGLVKCIGLSNFEIPDMKACHDSRAVNAIERHLSLLRTGYRGDIRWAARQGIPVLSFGALGFGLLTGTIDEGSHFAADDWRSGHLKSDDVWDSDDLWYADMFAPTALARSLAVANVVETISHRTNVTPAQLAIAWVLHQEGIAATIVGTRRIEHFAEDVRSGSIVLDSDILAELEAVAQE
jgi:aryl-alcohol dehydrogenase-like predicted oxidoreductase